MDEPKSQQATSISRLGPTPVITPDETVAPLFAPFTIPGLSLRNRFVMAPMTRGYAADGVPGQNIVDYYTRRAAAGVGLILTEGTYIDHPSAGSSPGVPLFHGEKAAAGWGLVAEAVHRQGGRIFPQLWHIGSEHHRKDGRGDASHVLSPSGLTITGAAHGRAMTSTDITQIIAAYARSAALAKRLGFDGVEIHAAHGYLIDQFLWAFTNRRSDAYGGDPLARSRFAVEVVGAIRAEVGADYPISFRFSQWKVGDYDARTAAAATELEDLLTPIAAAGVSIFHASTRRFWEPAFAGSDLTLAGWVRKITAKPVIAVGSVGLDGPLTPGDTTPRATTTDLSRVIKVFQAGECDLVAIGRALLANPAWIERVRTADDSSLRPYSRESTAKLY